MESIGSDALKCIQKYVAEKMAERYNSKKYFTRAEAKEAELEYLNKLKENVNVPTKMTFEDLWNAFLEYQDDKVRISTKVGYKYRGKYLVPLYKIKCVDFNIVYFENWKKYINSQPNMKDVSKNDILCYNLLYQYC